MTNDLIPEHIQNSKDPVKMIDPYGNTIELLRPNDPRRLTAAGFYTFKRKDNVEHLACSILNKKETLVNRAC